jgi:hypothetical protein
LTVVPRAPNFCALRRVFELGASVGVDELPGLDLLEAVTL